MEVSEKINLFGLTRGQLTGFLRRDPSESVALLDKRAASFGSWMYADKKISDKTQGISESYVVKLAETFDCQNTVKINSARVSKLDGSVKFLVQFKDGLLAETVLLLERDRLTLCVSSQVGCGQGCRFCQTGTMGLKRNLSAGEILGQYKVVADWIRLQPMFQNRLKSSCPPISNVVFMGMGEPLDNVQEVASACEALIDPCFFGLSRNKVTVSTVGLLEPLMMLLARVDVCIALSLHASSSSERAKMMPVELRSPHQRILETLKTKYPHKTIFVQYTLIHGVNDSVESSECLAELLKGTNCKVNLIPLNEHSHTSFRRPDLSRLSAFQAVLKKAGIVTTIRFSKGRDIEGACGQLVTQALQADKPVKKSEKREDLVSQL